MSHVTSGHRRPTAPPTVPEVREGLRARLTAADFDRVWSTACAEACLPTTVASLPDDRLDVLLAEISAQDRLCQVLALSWRVRCATARRLAAQDR